ncbi:mammalian cell entry protein [Niastella koreensis]|uniref:Mammalian cell entry related domain protein n=2 Tax=Niastella koreensis TaxID=354356 RepID=G8TD13_NIAKG|nr:MlaD family protein [Niastella koreensis]AEV98245.1 Mammalian cell entry related domain protein [Niastella koreensis GR20-10]OQP53300.1 mammalian cell entry protein [Niastella koreensis]
MAKKTLNTIKLGLFVTSGLLFLILLLYMIGKNRNLFGPSFILKAQFDNVQGLVPGNNVRYSGIEIGTVKKINILSDTVLEVVLVVDDNMKKIIRNNAIVSIGSDGLMGNKVINIAPARTPAPLVAENEILVTRKPVGTDEMLQTLSKTNLDVAVIAAQLRSTLQRINNSTALWKILNDEALPQQLHQSAANVQLATARAAAMAGDLQAVVNGIKNGKGSVGAVLTDTAFASNLNEAIIKIKSVGDRADELAGALNEVVADVKQEVHQGKGTVNALLKDSAMVVKINASLDNIQKGTDAFNQNMEAMKHNFLFRGYFKKQEKQRAKANKQNVAVQ